MSGFLASRIHVATAERCYAMLGINRLLLQHGVQLAKELEETVALAHLPRVGLRKRQRLANGIKDAEDAAEPPGVPQPAIHRVADRVLNHLALLVERQAARHAHHTRNQPEQQ
eukprot:706245-Pyramimonas_sp.AAC.2